MNSVKKSIIVPAAGSGVRVGGHIKKQYLLLKEKPIIVHTLEKVAKANLYDEIVVCVPKDDILFFKKEILKKYRGLKVSKVVAGGMTRQDSVLNAFFALSKDSVLVTVHDGVRPFISKEIFEKSIKAAALYGSCVVAVPEKNTVKEISKDGFVVKTLDRETIWEVQTPQTFKTAILNEAFLYAKKLQIEATDEASLVEQTGYQVKIIMGSYYNVKITVKEDLKIGEAILEL